MSDSPNTTMSGRVLVLAGKIGPAFGGAEIKSWGGVTAPIHERLMKVSEVGEGYVRDVRFSTLDVCFQSIGENLAGGAEYMNPGASVWGFDFWAPLAAADYFG